MEKIECKVGYGSIKGIWFQFNKIGDNNWYYVETDNQLAMDLFFDFIKISNGYTLKKQLF